MGHIFTIGFLKPLCENIPSPPNEQAGEVTNRQIKLILKKTVGQNWKEWSVKLIDALWSYRTAFKTILEMSLHRIVFEKSCHLPIKFEHRALWAIKQLNFDLNRANELRKLQISELEEIQNEAYDNAQTTKSRTKFFTIKSLTKKLLSLGKNFCSTTQGFTSLWENTKVIGRDRSLYVQFLHRVQ